MGGSLELGPRGVAGRFCLVALPLKLREGTVELGLRPGKGNVAWLVLLSLKGPWEAKVQPFKEGILSSSLVIVEVGSGSFGKSDIDYDYWNK